MKVVRAIAAEILSLFVSDWAQAGTILLVLALAFAASRRFDPTIVGFAVVPILGAHLVFAARADARRRRKSEEG
ncbi:MAG: hypothetical protein ACYDAY_10055 [Candidatus Dormibacteria bacterium]